ncbi:MAG: efflux RND transporter periplasmic adaptor subunit [Rhodospirillaceae bacterium]|nr:efflux RND transporter periplasmic adaptor subunit [Rhodospirillaceae bacterium]
MVIMLAAVGVVLGAIFGFGMFKNVMMTRYFASAGVPPQTVSTMTAKFDDWQPAISAVGSLKAFNGADLSLEAPGIVDEILFDSGEDVAAGTILVRLRADDDAARLRSLDASAQLAASNLERNLKQFESKAISQAALDVDVANLKSARAAVEEQRATLNKKVLRAPFAGRLGVRTVGVGQYLNPGSAIVTLQALDPIYAEFYLPPQQASRIRPGQKTVVKIDKDAAVGLVGVVSAVNPKVEINTRNVLVQATVKNPTQRLLPGTPIIVEIDTGSPERYLTLPQTAITYNPYGDTVFLALEDGKDDKGQPKYKASQTFVVTGLTRGDQIAVLTGIKEGDRIVTAGQLKIQNDTPLIINNSVLPSADPNPKPIDN